MNDNAPTPFSLVIKLVRIAVPIILTKCSIIGAMSINSAFLGHSVHNSSSVQGYIELTSNMTGLIAMLLFGHAAGLDTIIPQGIGANNVGRVRRGIAHYLTSTLLELPLLLAPLCVIIAWTIKSKGTVHVSHVQLSLYLYGTNFSLAIRMLLGKLLVFTDGEVKLLYTTIASLACTIVSQGLVIWLVPESPRRLHLLLLTEVLVALAIVLFRGIVIRWFHRPCHVYVPSWQDLRSIWTVKQWRSYFGLSFASGLIIFLDAGSVYGISLVAALLPDTRYVAVVGNISAIVIVFFSVAAGLTTASTSLIGRFIGKRDTVGALLAVRVAYVLALIVGLLDSALLILCRHSLSRLFSNDLFVISKVQQVLPVIAASHVLDVMQLIAQSVFRAVGQPSAGVKFQLLATYLVGMPVGIALTFGAHMDTFGLWIGQLVGYAVLAALTIGWSIVRWQSLAEQAIADLDKEDRSEHEQQPLIGSESSKSYNTIPQSDMPQVIVVPPATASSVN